MGRLDSVLGKPFYSLVIAIEDRVFAGSRAMHKISIFEAEEDEIILIHIFSSLFLKFMFPFDDLDQFSRFDTDVDAKHRKAIMSILSNSMVSKQTRLHWSLNRFSIDLVLVLKNN